MRDIIWIIGEKIMIALDSLDQLIDQGVSHFLIDASGVLYTDEGVVLGAKDAIQKLQALNKSVFLVTNNTSLSPSGIQKYLAAKSIFLPEEDILSSGLGLRWDKEANSLIYGKRCYVYGWDGSRFYVEYAGGLCVDDIQEAEVVVVLASLDTDNKEEVSSINERTWVAQHEHDDEVGSISIEKEGDLDYKKLQAWLSKLLGEKGVDIFRMKGFLSIDGDPDRFVFQGVHMLFDGKPDRPWGKMPRKNQLVFIGRNLDEEAMRAGFESCLVKV